MEEPSSNIQSNDEINGKVEDKKRSEKKKYKI